MSSEIRNWQKESPIELLLAGEKMRVIVTVPKPLLERFDAWWQAKNYPSRSVAMTVAMLMAADSDQ